MGICTSTHTRVRSAPADSSPSRRPLRVDVQPQKSETRDSQSNRESSSNRDSPPTDSTWTPRDVTLSIGSSSATSKKLDIKDADQYESNPLLKYIRNNVIGHGLLFNGPFGTKQVFYCDYTASGRSLAFIEDYIRKYVCPYYGNTHTTTSINSRQTSHFRDDSRAIIKKCLNCSKDDVVIFTGSGVTGAIHKLIWALCLYDSDIVKTTGIIIGPYEHHSNILPWKETGAKLTYIKETKNGKVDTQHLEEVLKKLKQEKKKIIAAFSAASNVTGIMTDTDAVSELIHQYGGYVIWDYAAGGPYMKIDMNSSEKSYKDAVMISPHKFVGGPGTPGILVAKRWMFVNAVPGNCGGGTVLYVTPNTHAFLKDIESREEGGTPSIIESIRAGMVFQLKEDIGYDVIEERERYLCRKTFAAFRKNENIIILGSHSSERIPIFSFLVKHEESGHLLHHNFVSSVLCDLYGVQARGGCACAGPYAVKLLGMTDEQTQIFVELLESSEENGKQSQAMEIMKPGFTRINMPFFYSEEDIDYIIHAVDMVAKYGWKLLPYYTYNITTGNWQHRTFWNKHQMISLKHIGYTDKGMDKGRVKSPRYMNQERYKLIQSAEADIILQNAEKEIDHSLIKEDENLDKRIPEQHRHLRWFLTPFEALAYLQIAKKKEKELPFQLKRNYTVLSNIEETG